MDQLAAKIRQSFDFDPPPLFPDFGPNWELSESFEETGHFKGKPWDELSVSDFETYTCCHSFFSNNVALYYFGANMYVECVSEQFWSMAMDRLFMCSGWQIGSERMVYEVPPQIDFFWKQMNEPQKSVVLEYLALAAVGGPSEEIKSIRDALAKATQTS